MILNCGWYHEQTVQYMIKYHNVHNKKNRFLSDTQTGIKINDERKKGKDIGEFLLINSPIGLEIVDFIGDVINQHHRCDKHHHRRVCTNGTYAFYFLIILASASKSSLSSLTGVNIFSPTFSVFQVFSHLDRLAVNDISMTTPAYVHRGSFILAPKLLMHSVHF